MRMSCVPKGEGRATSHLLSMMDSQPFPRDGPGRNANTHRMVVLQVFCYASLHHRLRAVVGCTCDTRHDSSGLGNIHCSVLPRLPWHHAVHATKTAPAQEGYDALFQSSWKQSR